MIRFFTCVIAGSDIVVDIMVPMHGEYSAMAGVNIFYVFLSLINAKNDTPRSSKGLLVTEAPYFVSRDLCFYDQRQIFPKRTCIIRLISIHQISQSGSTHCQVSENNFGI